MERNQLLKLTTDIVAEYSATNRIAGGELPKLIQSTYDAFAALGAQPEPPITNVVAQPAVSLRKSLADRSFILSMIDGKPYSTLKRHLARHGLTPAQYRERFGLEPDYPMTAPAYSERKSAMAKQIGLGRSGARSPGLGRREHARSCRLLTVDRRHLRYGVASGHCSSRLKLPVANLDAGLFCPPRDTVDGPS